MLYPAWKEQSQVLHEGNVVLVGETISFPWYVESMVFLCENVKTGVKTWFQIAGVTVIFSDLVRECVKIVISNREILDVLGCLDIN